MVSSIKLNLSSNIVLETWLDLFNIAAREKVPKYQVRVKYRETKLVTDW